MPSKELSRRSYKGQLTTVKKVIEKYQQDPLQLENENAETELRANREMIDRIEKKFVSIQSEIINEAPPETKEKEKEELLGFLDEALRAEMEINTLIALFQTKVADQSVSSPANASHQGDDISKLVTLMSQQLKEQRQQRLSEETKLKDILEAQKEEMQRLLEISRNELANTSLDSSLLMSPIEQKSNLEPIKLPKFSGSYTEWPTFKNLFLSTVDSKPRLSKAEKMHYLRTSTQGEALGLFNQLPLTEENYAIAWNRLVNRYDDKMIIFRSYMESFLNQEQITKPDVTALRKLQSATSQALEAIDALGVSERDPWLIHLTLRHLDRQTQTLWSEKKPEGIPTWTDFDNFLNTRCRVLESCPAAAPQQLRIANVEAQEIDDLENFDLPSNNSATLSCSGASGGVRSNVLFATAIVKLLGPQNTSQLCRIVLDPASQINIITNHMCQLLKLNPKRTNFVIDGVGSISQASQQEVQVKMQYQRGQGVEVENLSCIVMKKVVGDQPNWDVDVSKIPLPSHFKLADPKWHVRQKIDLLIGGGHAWQYLGAERVSLGVGLPMLQQSVFGWLVVGPCFEARKEVASCGITTLSSIDRTLKKFWEVEEIPKKPQVTVEYQEVENHFQKTTFRGAEGRYVVQLPLRSEIQDLNNNRLVAIRQLNYLFPRLQRNPKLFEDYSNIFREYLSLNIIERVPSCELHNPSYYFPHHAVVKENAVSTKTRVVFNASSQSRSGLSLNDCLKACPVVQPTLISVLWRFRMNEVAVTCDIVKMYLQVMMHPQHQDFHRFVWKEEDELIDFRFTRVCFGVAASPFLATRVLNQIAEDEGQKFPLAKPVLKENFYVDDCLYSASSCEEVLEVKQQLIDMLRTGGMELSKFRSNRPEVVAGEHDEHESTSLILDQEAKTLGVIWTPQTDEFQFRIAKDLGSQPMTKRNILSTIARIFDPCGFIGPAITTAKLIMQNTWQKNVGWDDEVPEDLGKRWKKFVADVTHVEKLRIPRWICPISDPCVKELHAFCDASQLAYGVVIYVVYEDSMGNRSSGLLTAKSRVTPIKAKDDGTRLLTIPKAELVGAELAAQLMAIVGDSLGIKNQYFWTDAMVILHQIHSKEIKETFVRNKISNIKKTSNAEQWRHIPTSQNPADVLSRGTSMQLLISNTLWWQGPSWLVKSREHWPPKFSPIFFSKPIPQTLACTESHADPSSVTLYDYFISKFSSFMKATRVLAWVKRGVENFKYNLLKRRTTRSVSNSTKSQQFLQVSELQAAEKILIRWDQERHLSSTIRLLKSNHSNNVITPIRKLHPYMDSNDILRVGGRIQFSENSYDARHPIILPQGTLALWIARAEHLRLLHAGPQLTLASMRQKYWAIHGRNLVRKIVRECIVCIRAKPITSQQLMGSLPECRVNLVRPFLHTGVDFTGHVTIKRTPRGSSHEKAYVCIFICMSSKAVHLEVLTSLSSKAFISAFRRFIARRGMPSHMYSDNATNFVAGEKEIRQILNDHNMQQEIVNITSGLNIQWHFNPPSAPHQGGLWEAAVRSFKHHFKRVIGTMILTYEELNTVVVQIEAVLNSRPLVTIHDNPGDLQCLTPGDFLIGKAPTQLPVEQNDFEQVDHLRRWQLCTKLRNDFLTRWKKEYIHTLQQRQRWNKESPNLSPGDVVLLKAETTSNIEWPMGLIEKVFPGEDGKVRVALVKVNSKSLLRPITKLVKLPVKLD
ncbi:uncharacterized protein LOC129808613 [Phlebotomus papatasi]|uniref:uncharacterized protein LOC129808613 n=1 Tax=Phlebotomus papatasi TaxID=29031 RepID=UPI002483FCEA|nr:uncharacterized protein LOC129808613 [Phlebotomus papatasi]